MFSEFVGVTQEVASLIESHRSNVKETKSDILLRLLRPAEQKSSNDTPGTLQLGQGAELKVGEDIFLFLSKSAKKANAPDGVATVRSDGIYIEGQRVSPSRGSIIHPAMQFFQNRKGHRNSDGAFVSLSAWRQWHVIRNEKLIPLDELKEPSLARKRGRPIITTEMLLEELDLMFQADSVELQR